MKTTFNFTTSGVLVGGLVFVGQFHCMQAKNACGPESDHEHHIRKV